MKTPKQIIEELKVKALSDRADATRFWPMGIRKFN